LYGVHESLTDIHCRWQGILHH